tara:strand:+ start:380 stop:541 length:162 start_codon:yes stop_codon:yes gene_type:complete
MKLDVAQTQQLLVFQQLQEVTRFKVVRDKAALAKVASKGSEIRISFLTGAELK